MRDLLVAVPSRGRPASVQRLWEAMQSTCRGDTTLLAGLDADDEHNYPRLDGVEYEVFAGLRGVVALLNAMTVPRAGGYRFVGTLGDDNLPRTGGWDVALMDALAHTPLAFGNDLYPREPGSLPCHVFMRSEVIKALGYMGPPCLKHMFVDPVWLEWGRACGITYLPGVILEHLHFTVGKAPVDGTYRAAVNCWPADEAAYHAYLAGPEGLAADVAKIRAVL